MIFIVGVALAGVWQAREESARKIWQNALKYAFVGALIEVAWNVLGFAVLSGFL